MVASTELRNFHIDPDEIFPWCGLVDDPRNTFTRAILTRIDAKAIPVLANKDPIELEAVRNRLIHIIAFSPTQNRCP